MKGYRETSKGPREELPCLGVPPRVIPFGTSGHPLRSQAAAGSLLVYSAWFIQPGLFSLVYSAWFISSGTAD
jgi:hypothetical protein